MNSLPLARIAALGFLCGIFGACAGSPHPLAAVTTPGTVLVSSLEPAPVVEAYLEFVGPPERWAGPQTLTVHLTARDGDFARLAVTPPLPAEGARVNSREPQGAFVGSNLIAPAAVRESLAELAAAVRSQPDQDQTFSGCLFPLRLKLIQADGVVTEKDGCRTLTGWPLAFARATDRVLTVSVAESNRTLAMRKDPEKITAPHGESLARATPVISTH